MVVSFAISSSAVRRLRENSWIISSLSEDHRIKDNKGQTVQAAVNVSLEEYVKEVSTISG